MGNVIELVSPYQSSREVVSGLVEPVVPSQRVGPFVQQGLDGLALVHGPVEPNNEAFLSPDAFPEGPRPQDALQRPAGHRNETPQTANDAFLQHVPADLLTAADLANSCFSREIRRSCFLVGEF